MIEFVCAVLIAGMFIGAMFGGVIGYCIGERAKSPLPGEIEELRKHVFGEVAQ